MAIAISSCRICGFDQLTPIFSLGELYVSNFIDSPEQQKEIKASLELVLCNESNGGCGLLQLKHTVPQELMYQNYWYRSGMNKTMIDELHGIATKAESLLTLSAGDLVLDIGANDGTLLRGYKINGLNLIGFEPAQNLISYAVQGTTKIINDFFSFVAWKQEFGNVKSKVVTAIAMFYDLDDPNAFVADVARCLDKEGIFIIQMSYLPSMLYQNAFDNICHEHLEYYSLLSLENLLRRHGLEVFDVELNDVNGGSFRTYVKHVGEHIGINIPLGAGERVKKLRAEELKLGLNNRKIYDEFARRVYDLRQRLCEFIRKEAARGKKIHVYGASTKGNTLLQFYGLDNRLIVAAAERNPDKWGRKTTGTLIPIISEEQARREKPDYFLVLPWHFMKEFRQREAEFLKNGGKFIVPLPEFRIVSE